MSRAARAGGPMEPAMAKRLLGGLHVQCDNHHHGKECDALGLHEQIASHHTREQSRAEQSSVGKEGSAVISVLDVVDWLNGKLVIHRLFSWSYRLVNWSFLCWMWSIG